MLAKGLYQPPGIKVERTPGSTHFTATSITKNEVDVKEALKVYGKVHVVSSEVSPGKPGTQDRVKVTFKLLSNS